jgi:hypothetical protein
MHLYQLLADELGAIVIAPEYPGYPVGVGNSANFNIFRSWQHRELFSHCVFL